jgi:translation initiation factor 2B subunit (eIF-2B alpha/beta/delta family)
MCVTSTDKLDERDHRDKEEMEENDPEEVSQMWPVNVDRALVTVRNIYFEWVDGGLIDLYMTERGVLSRESISRISQERQELAKVWDILDC